MAASTEALRKLLENWRENMPHFTVLTSESSRLNEERSENDPHLHDGWELKFEPGTGLILVMPRVVHESSQICPFGCEVNTNEFNLSLLGTIWFYRRHSITGTNCLPELFALLARPELRSKTMQAQLLLVVFEALLTLVERLCREPEEADDPCDRALRYMELHYYRRDLDAEQLAAWSGVTQQYLNRLFQRKEGSSVRQKLISIRLEKARELLESGNYLVSDAASLTGWSCPYYFSRSFKHYFGVAPGAVRR